jgi:hypothetical protein
MTTATRQLESWKKANPWVVQNMQNSSALCGRFPTREAAEAEANQRGGVVLVSGHTVFFSQMPQL